MAFTRESPAHSMEGKLYIESELKEMGKPPARKKSAGCFTRTALLWIGKDIINASQKLIQPTTA